MAFVNIPGNSNPILVFSATGTGPGSTAFVHDLGVEGNYPGELYPAVFIFAITDIVGSFSALQVNLEWSPITPDVGPAQYQTVGTWTPLANPVTYFACSASGMYRLNCTTFTGGTSFNVYVSIASTMPQSTGGGGGGGSVTQGTVPWADNITQVAGVTLGATAVVAYGSTPAAVNVPGVNAFITNAGSIGGGVQFADNAASGATPTGTLDMGWDSVNSKIRALKVDASQNLLVAVNAALPAGTNVIGHVIVDSGAITVSGSVSVSNFPATQIVAGAKTPADSFTNPTDAVDTFALLGGWDATNSKWQRVQVDAATGTLKVDPGTVTVTGSVSVSNFPATQPVSGTVAVTQSTNPWIVAGAKTPADSFTNPTDAVDTFALLGGWDATNSKWQRVQVDAATGTLKVDPGTVTVTGSVSVSNFPATQNVSGTTTDGTTTETNFLVVGGESNDATAQYQPIPLGAGGRSVIIEGVASGTAVPISGSVSVSNFPATQPVSGTVTANQGTPNTLANKWPVQVTDGTNVMPTGDVIARALFQEITDGTNGPVAVKAASTGAAATDSALTVSLSPNSPVSILASGAAAKWTGLNLAGINPGHVVIVDSSGSGTVPAVKAASTAPLATDPALVVAISPNNTIATSPALPPNAAQESGGNLVQLRDYLQTLILEIRAMRTALVYMVTENGDVPDSDFNPASADFQPVS